MLNNEIKDPSFRENKPIQVAIEYSENIKDKFFETLLFHENVNPEIADLKGFTKRDNTMLIAFLFGNSYIIETLIENTIIKQQMHSSESFYQYFTIHILQNAKIDIVKLFFTKYIDYIDNLSENKRNELINYACESGNYELVDYILSFDFTEIYPDVLKTIIKKNHTRRFLTAKALAGLILTTWSISCPEKPPAFIIGINELTNISNGRITTPSGGYELPSCDNNT